MLSGGLATLGRIIALVFSESIRMPGAESVAPLALTVVLAVAVCSDHFLELGFSNDMNVLPTHVYKFSPSFVFFDCFDHCVIRINIPVDFESPILL